MASRCDESGHGLCEQLSGFLVGAVAVCCNVGLKFETHEIRILSGTFNFCVSRTYISIFYFSPFSDTRTSYRLPGVQRFQMH